MPYFVCESCSRYYKLQEGELSDIKSCECGNKLDYYDYIPLEKVWKKCSRCGFEDELYYSLNPLACTCPKCLNNKGIILDKCPICSFEGKLLEQKYSEHLGLVYTCPNCRNSFGILERENDTRNSIHYLDLIKRRVRSIIMHVLNY